jgi:high-affinity Fe2+/Pb2+ permease
MRQRRTETVIDVLLAVIVATGVREQNSVRIATMVFIAVAAVGLLSYRIYHVRKNRKNQEFFENMKR